MWTNRRARDLRSEHQGKMLHMYSILVGASRTPAPHLSHVGELQTLMEVPAETFLPSSDDVSGVKSNLVVLVSSVLTKYFTKLAPFAKVVLSTSGLSWHELQ